MKSFEYFEAEDGKRTNYFFDVILARFKIDIKLSLTAVDAMAEIIEFLFIAAQSIFSKIKLRQSKVICIYAHHGKPR